MNKRYLIVTILFAILIITGSLLAADEICHNCGKKITHAAIQAGDYFYHPSCFKCSVCGKKITESKYYFLDDKLYHVDCYEKSQAIYCRYCGDKIVGPYVVHDGYNYHTSCYENNIGLKCDLCGKPIKGDYTTYEGHNYHPECYTENVALRCYYCDGPINGNYYFDWYGHNYHTFHDGSASQCDYCRGYFHESGPNKNGSVYEDGRKVCDICASTAVTTKDEAKKIAEEINEQLEMFQLDVDLDEVNFHLVPKDKLRSFNKLEDMHTYGFTRYQKKEYGFGLIVDTEMEVYILKGMPYYLAMMTIAHELNHVWQYDIDFDSKDPAFCEGSCNFVGYLIISNQVDPIAEILSDNQFKESDPIYGEGFKRVHKLVKDKGIDYWRNHLANNKEFPPGY